MDRKHGAQTFSHLDERNRPAMVDVSGKEPTLRKATARARVHVGDAVIAMIRERTNPKGEVLTTAQLAGIMGAKETSRLIPLCHPLQLTDVAVEIEIVDAQRLEIVTRAAAFERTGVEMEAITAAAVAALTVYDMCKAVNRAIVIEEICLLEKSGGSRGDYRRIEG